MPDLLTFDEKLDLQTLVGTVALTGTLNVTYGAPPSAIGSLTVGAFGAFGAQTFQNITLSSNGSESQGVPTYLLAGTNGVTSIAIGYVGSAPLAASVQLTDASTHASLAAITAAPIVSNIVCVAQGTLIRTKRGDVLVERLKLGDKVLTDSGTHSPIRWLGHRTIDCRRHPDPRAVLPIRISAGALGRAEPGKDLYVSPGHGILVPVVDDVLIPASLLCNGSSVQQVEVEEMTYWHVELERHDILFSNGLRTESYIDVGNRTFFSGPEEKGPDGERSVGTLANYCRPYIVDEAIVRAVRQRLQSRAEGVGWALDLAPASGLHLVVDGKVLRPGSEDGLTARFVVPAGAADVWLCSDTTVPAFILETWDARRLGVGVSAISVGSRRIPADDPSFCVGFYPPEGEAPNVFRWTTGSAFLPEQLWDGDRETRLEIELAAPALPRWTLQAERAALSAAA